MNVSPTCRGQGDRRGIALVVVLGFVAVLAILAVSIAVTMRVERLASASYRDTVGARQLVQAALAAALDDMDLSMLGQRYPNTDVITITGSNNTYALSTDIFSGESLDFVPSSLSNSLPKSILMTNIVVGTSVVGRVGYCAVNCSGLLDANIINAVNRGAGRSGAEITMNSAILPDVNNPLGFRATRASTWRRFETVPDLSTVALGRPSQNLFTYSLFRQDFMPNGTNKVYLGGEANNLLSNRVDIVEGLRMSGVANPEMVFSNLLDYVDMDNVSQDLNSFCTEAVPMINEVVFSNTISRTVSVTGGFTNEIHTHRVYCTIETWYPFPGAAAATLSPNPPPVTFPVCVPNGLQPNPATDLKTAGVQTLNHGPFSFQVAQYMYEKVATNIVGWGPGGAIGIRARLDGPVEVQMGNVPVDRVDLTAIGAPTWQWTVANAASVPLLGVTGGVAGASVSDPRLNYSVARWMKDLPTISNVNNNATGGEGISPMYVRDFPLEQPKAVVGEGSVGELGFLSVGLPWRTIALYDAPGTNLNPVLDYFTLMTGSTVRGKVNVNTWNAQVLACAVDDMTLEPYPGAGGTTRMDADAALYFATNIVRKLRMNPADRYSTNRSISVIGSYDANFCAALNGLITSPVLTNDALRESLVRNSHELFGVRQNIFTVFLFAQSLTPAGFVAAEQRAVAVVWRDPELDSAADKGSLPSLNRSFVRFFKWL